MAVKPPFSENCAFLMGALVQGTTPNKLKVLQFSLLLYSVVNSECSCWSVALDWSLGSHECTMTTLSTVPLPVCRCPQPPVPQAFHGESNSLWSSRQRSLNITQWVFFVKQNFWTEKMQLFHHLIRFLNPSQLTRRTLTAGAVPLCELPSVLSSIPPSPQPEHCWTYTGASVIPTMARTGKTVFW